MEEQPGLTLDSKTFQHNLELAIQMWSPQEEMLDRGLRTKAPAVWCFCFFLLPVTHLFFVLFCCLHFSVLSF